MLFISALFFSLLSASISFAENPYAWSMTISDPACDYSSRMRELGDKASDASSEVNSKIREKQEVLSELRQGLFCSKCLRSKSELDRTEGFENHLEHVKGHPVPASAEQINKRASEFDKEIAALTRQKTQSETNMANLKREFNNCEQASQKRKAEEHQSKKEELQRKQEEQRQTQTEKARLARERAAEQKSQQTQDKVNAILGKNQAMQTSLNQLGNTIQNILEEKQRKDEARQQAADAWQEQEELKKEQRRSEEEYKRKLEELEAENRRAVKEIERKEKLAETISTAGSLYDSPDTTQMASDEPRESLLSRTSDLYADMKQKAVATRIEAQTGAHEIQDAIKKHLSELRQAGQSVRDWPNEFIRNKIESLPEDKRFRYEVYYYTFVNPHTNSNLHSR